jgi:hypothetical protein
VPRKRRPSDTSHHTVSPRDFVEKPFRFDVINAQSCPVQNYLEMGPVFIGLNPEFLVFFVSAVQTFYKIQF